MSVLGRSGDQGVMWLAMLLAVAGLALLALRGFTKSAKVE